ncbi:pyridoxine 5'-phosphate synthase [Aestuariivirga litoralis]|uniref:Pyridoxine 5'-phosphate synthase n=1 Tax=Aestuariivirga litoralis TaxID=2650924 RepID=A0A2W2AKR7_9HYPH|nr:pyridoxine 5'-phosphate synthase [Aestuariivirga litoralis]PZF75951.1 pyridoxine 5'-phosphate synthase [Aestuariivirga litoralis]
MPCKLSVNVNAIAYLRNRRHVPWPSLTDLCHVALDNGAVGITVHPRPDERHIRRTDVTDISKLLRAEYPGAEFNIEGYPDERFLTLCEAERPEQVTLVPDDPTQSTSDHGWDIAANRDRLTAVIARLHKSGARVALFIDPDPAVPALAKAVGADRVEIYTGPYGGAFEPAARAREFDRVVATGKAAEAAGLGLNAGHDLTRENLPALVKALPNLQEVSIGHAITADALMFGLGETVRKFRTAIGDL